MSLQSQNNPIMKKMGAKIYTIDKVPSEVLNEVFAKLPAKDALRCKFVCKSWLSIISDPQFACHHLNTVKEILSHKRRICFIKDIKNNLVKLYDHESDSHEYLKLPFCNESTIPEFLSSCNGLLLVGTGDKDHFLWNPSVGSYRQVPCAYTHFKDDPTRGSRYFKLYGLGYDLITKAYIVVRIIRKIHKAYSYDSTTVRFYSSRTESWQKIDDFPYTVVVNEGVILKGAPHWIVARKDKVREYVIIYFDMAEDAIKEVKTWLPTWLLDEGAQFRFGVLKESLCLVDNKQIHADVWVMKEPATCWIKLVSVRGPDIYSIFDKLSKDFLPIRLTENGEKDVCFSYGDRVVEQKKRVIRGTLGRHPKVTRKLRQYPPAGNEQFRENELYWFDGPINNVVFDTVTYVASLVSPHT